MIVVHEDIKYTEELLYLIFNMIVVHDNISHAEEHRKSKELRC